MLIVCWKRLALLFITLTAAAPLALGASHDRTIPVCASHVADVGVQDLLFGSFALPLSSVQERAVLLAPSHRSMHRIGPRFHTRDAFAFTADGKNLYVGYHTAEIGQASKSGHRSGVHISRFVARPGASGMERDNFSLDLDNQSLRRFVVSHDGQLLATGHDPRDAEDAELVGIWKTGSSTYVSTTVEVEEEERGAVVDMAFSMDDLFLVVAYEDALDVFHRPSVTDNFSASPTRTIFWPSHLVKSEAVLTADPTGNRISVFYGGRSTVLDFNLPLASQGSANTWLNGFTLTAGERTWHHPAREISRGNLWFPSGFGGNREPSAAVAYLTGEQYQEMPIVALHNLSSHTTIPYAVRGSIDTLAQVEISPDGRWLATLGPDFFCVWNLENQNHHCALTSLPKTPKSIQFRGLRFSPDSLSLLINRDVVVSNNIVPQVALIPLKTFESIWSPK